MKYILDVFVALGFNTSLACTVWDDPAHHEHSLTVIDNQINEMIRSNFKRPLCLAVAKRVRKIVISNCN
jgi:hypothetical protein